MTIEQTVTREIFPTPNSGRRVFLTAEGINAQQQDFPFFFFNKHTHFLEKNKQVQW